MTNEKYPTRGQIYWAVDKRQAGRSVRVDRTDGSEGLVEYTVVTGRDSDPETGVGEHGTVLLENWNRRYREKNRWETATTARTYLDEEITLGPKFPEGEELDTMLDQVEDMAEEFNLSPRSIAKIVLEVLKSW